MKKLILIIFVGLFLVMNGCLSKKALPSNTYNFDYNQRIYVDNAYFKKRISIIGSLTSIGMAGAGALIANEAKITNTYDNQNVKTTNQPINYAIGGMSGLGVSFIFHEIGGLGKIKEIETEKMQRKWIRKKLGNPDKFVIVNFRRSLSTFKITHISMESTWDVRNFQDVTDFLDFFPNSNYTTSVIDKSVATMAFSLDNCINLYKVYKFTKHSSYALEKISLKAQQYVTNVDELLLFQSAFGDIPAIDTLIDVLSNRLTGTALDKLIENFLPRKSLIGGVMRLINRAESLQETLNIFERYGYQYPIQEKIEEHAFNFAIQSYANAQNFKSKFPNSKFIKRTDNGQYIGKTYENMPNGKGVIFFGNGDVYSGNWTNGIMIGNGVYQNKGGRGNKEFIYEGEFNQNKFNGIGTIKFDNNTILKGKFQNDAMISFEDVSREALLTYLNIDGDNATAKQKYAALANSIEECVETKNRFSEYSQEMEQKAFSLVSNQYVSSPSQFLSLFPNSKYEDQVRNLLAEAKVNEEERERQNALQRQREEDEKQRLRIARQNCEYEEVRYSKYQTYYSASEPCGKISYTEYRYKCWDNREVRLYFWPGNPCATSSETKEASYFSGSNRSDNLRTTDFNEAIKKACNCGY